MTNTKQQKAVKQIKKYLELPHRETVISTNTIQTKPFDNQKTMSNNKQSSIDWLVEKMLTQDWYTYKSLEYIKQAKAMHKEEIENSYDYMRCIGSFTNGKEYYNETFK